jgi:hypothetical protein
MTTYLTHPKVTCIITKYIAIIGEKVAYIDVLILRAAYYVDL